MPAALVLHDVYGSDGAAATGFGGADADRYKLSVAGLGRVLDSVATAGCHPAVDLDTRTDWPAAAVALTFDDGGVGAVLHTADLLEARGWRGWFMIVTGRLGQPGFLAPAQVRELHHRGHVIGTHTHSHPVPISGLPLEEIVEEWAQSRAALEDLLGAEVRTGSVPAGFYSRRVGQAADRAGLRLLFTSEPVRGEARAGSCRVVGRYGVLAATPPGRVTALLRGEPLSRLREWAWWNLKKAPKSLGGGVWLALRRRLLSAGPRP